MKSPIERALDAASDAAQIDWQALEGEAPDAESLETLRALRDLTQLARAHATTTAAPQLPFTWGPLVVREHLAHGAHGDVYRAWEPRLHRDVALKILRDAGPDDADGPSAIAEGRRLAKVRHPNVVIIHGADRIDGQAGIWMEFVDGSTLHQIVSEEGPMKIDDAAEIAMAVCSGLAAIHEASLVHRDIKAQNVVRDRSGRVLLMDLGAGQELADSNESIEGTPLYFAPEALHGERATVSSDIYAVGVLLFFLVTGRYPVAASSLAELRNRHHRGPVERLAGRMDLPGAFSAVVDRALATNPAARFSSVEEMRTALELARRPHSRSVSMIVLTVLLLVATIGAIASVAFSRVETRRRGAGSGDTENRIIALPRHPVGGPSGDGRYFPYVDRAGHLMVWEVAAGTSTRVLEASPNGAVTATVMSRAGDRIAYGWKLPDGGFELRVIGVNGRWMQTLLPRQHAYEPIPLDWPGDARAVLCSLRQQDGTSDLVLVPVDGQRVRHLHTFASQGMVQGRMSPDGRFAIASAKAGYGDLASVIIAASDGSQSRTLLEGEFYELPAWMPDGRHVVVLRESSEQKNSRDAWLVRVVNGAAAGEPILAARDLGAVLDLWVTDEGSLYRTTSTLSSNVYTAAIDLSGATSAGAPSRVASQHLGQQVAPAWSPDGRSLAYIVREDAGRPGLIANRTLWIKDMLSGSSRHVPLRLSMLGGYTPAWRPDGHAIAVWARDSDAPEGVGYFEVDVHSGAARPLVKGGINPPTYSQYGPDARLFYFVDTNRGIVVRDLVSGTDQVLVGRTRNSRPGTFAVSPDGRSLAYEAHVDEDGSKWSAVRVMTIGGPDHLVVRHDPPLSVVVHGWTPRGDGIVYGRASGGRQSLWRVSPSGGDPVDLRFEGPVPPNPFRLDATGTRLAFPERGGQTELRTLVHFFPPRHLGSVPQ